MARVEYGLDRSAEASAWYVSGPAQIRVVEDGPVRVAVEVVRQTEGSTFRQTVRLSEGDAGNRVEFSDVIDWQTSNANLKATFSLTAANANATYNWDIGTIERGNNDERKFEVPSHQWFDLTDRSGTFGVTILTDCKYGSDKPDDKTLRLTLLRTPGIAHAPDMRISRRRIGAVTRFFMGLRHMPVTGVAHRLTGTRNV